jgi:hypothetical protein
MDLDDEGRRRLAAALFNHVWTLLDREERTVADDDEMVHAAHASAFHWMAIGTAANRARSEWQCSRVYAVLGRAEPALHHARRCREIAEGSPGEVDDWDVPFAYEALARAHAVAGDEAAAREWLTRAKAAGEAIAEEEDRLLLESDLATIGT